MGDKEEGEVKNLKKWVISFMDGPRQVYWSLLATSTTEFSTMLNPKLIKID